MKYRKQVYEALRATHSFFGRYKDRKKQPSGKVPLTKCSRAHSHVLSIARSGLAPTELQNTEKLLLVASLATKT